VPFMAAFVDAYQPRNINVFWRLSATE